MFLRRLWLRNFRNYEEISLSFGAKIALFQGNNSQGKTNLLEAIYYLSSLSSPHCSRPQEMVRHGTPGFSLRAKVEDESAERELTICWGENGRALWMGGKRVHQPGRQWNSLPAVIFSPDDLSLISEGHEGRRRLLDRCAIRENRSHLEELARLRRILMQRNRLLRLGERRQLPFWDEQLCRSWTEIYRGRTQIVSQMNRAVPSVLQALGAEKEAVFRYRPALGQEVEFPPPDLLGHLRRSWEQEMRAGCSLLGPHRDEVLVELNGYDARSFSSRGERRLLALSLKLFELSHLERIGGRPPLILLDDLFSELDEERRGKAAVALLRGGQAIVTCTDLRPIQSLLPGAEAFCIREGRAERVAQD